VVEHFGIWDVELVFRWLFGVSDLMCLLFGFVIGLVMVAGCWLLVAGCWLMVED
jgi:hypothetical protein